MKLVLIVEENSAKMKERFYSLLDILGTSVDKSILNNIEGEITTLTHKFRFIIKGKMLIGFKFEEVMYFCDKDDYYYDNVIPCLKVI